MESELNQCQTETCKATTENAADEGLDQESVVAEEAATTEKSEQDGTEENTNRSDGEEAKSDEQKTNDGNINPEENEISSINTENSNKHEQETKNDENINPEENEISSINTENTDKHEQETKNDENINPEENEISSINAENTDKHEQETECIRPAGADIVDDTKEEPQSTKTKTDSGVTDCSAQAESTKKTDTKKASDKRRDCSADLPRSTTMPKSYGRSSKKDIAEKFGGVATSGIRVKRSTSCGAGAVKNMLLEWCRAKTRGREGVDIQNFSSSWSNGLAFCALIVAFFPDAFDYDSLDPKNRRQNFQLAFSTAEELADCPPLLDIEDMVRMKVPDSKCVYTYVQELYRSLVAKGLVKTKKA